MAPKARKARSNRVSKSLLEVAEILSQLPDLIAKFESIRSTGVHWGCKRVRTPRVSLRLTDAKEANDRQTSSPVTPFHLLPNGLEEKLNHSKRNPSLKRRSEDLSAELVNLNMERESLMVSSGGDEKEKTQIAVKALVEAYFGIEARRISRMMAAETRQQRVNIRRVKNPIAFRKPHRISR